MKAGYCDKCGAYCLEGNEGDSGLLCPKCADWTETPLGESAPTTRCDDANIPLELQRRLLKASFYDTMVWLQSAMDDDDFISAIEEMAMARLEHNHPKYGSTMYTWDEPRRRRAMMEELADLFVFASSGEY